MGIVRSPEVYEQFEKVVLVHGTRLVSELAYDDLIRRELPEHPLLGEQVAKQLLYYPTVTREQFRHQGRIPALLETGRLAHEVGLAPVDPAHDRFMLCGSPAMLADTRAVLEKLGLGRGQHEPAGPLRHRARLRRQVRPRGRGTARCIGARLRHHRCLRWRELPAAHHRSRIPTP